MRQHTQHTQHGPAAPTSPAAPTARSSAPTPSPVSDVAPAPALTRELEREYRAVVDEILELRGDDGRIRAFVRSITEPGALADTAGYSPDLSFAQKCQLLETLDVVSVFDENGRPVRGEKGEPVEITVERAGLPNTITVRVRRDEVKLPSVRNAFMAGQFGTGYIALTGGFSSKTDEELTEALAQLKQEGMRQLILDLRGNPGGLLDEAIKVSKKFLAPAEKIVEVRGRDEESSAHTYDVPDDNVPETIPMVVLVDRQTASASEIVAGALQDHDRALIVGENTFGKGLVQGVFHLWGGTGLVLTTAKYYTPTGRSIQRNYSNVSFYDYYLNRSEDHNVVTNAPHGDALRTDLGRTVYGGGGITPDVEVKAPPVSSRLFYGIFDFARQLAAGQMAGLREYRITECQYKTKVSAEEINRYPITDDLLAAFRQYISNKPQFNASEERINANVAYIRAQMRRELITAAYGPEGGDQVYLSDDVQFRKAFESLDRARVLADNARRARADRP